MMYDIVIQKNGGLSLLNGDIQNATFERYIAQKIYAAVMEIPPDLLSGRSTASAETMQRTLQQYFNDHFMNDPDIDYRNLVCILDENVPVTHIVMYTLTYTGTSPEGKSISFTSDFRYSLESGSLDGVVYEIKYPNVNLGEPYEVEEFVKITSMTQEVELPVTPFLGPSTTSVFSPVVLIPPSLSGSIEEITLPYIISTDGIRKTYQIDQYITGFDINKHSVKELSSMYTSPDDMDCSVFDKYGRTIVRTSSEGTISGFAEVITAKYLTYEIRYSDTYLNRNVYSLKPTSGRCLAVFPGTIAPGEYILKYTGVTQP